MASSIPDEPTRGQPPVAPVRPQRATGRAPGDGALPGMVSRVQARVGRRLLRFVGRTLLGFRFQIEGIEHVPAGEPVIVAGGPHRSWIDPFLIIIALPASPRVVYLGSAQAMFNRRWKRLLFRLMGGVVPVSSLGQLNREGLETSLAILDGGHRLGVFPEGWGQFEQDPETLTGFKRGVAFLSQRSGRRVLPVGLGGTQRLWRGKTLHVRICPPRAALDPAAGKLEQEAYVAGLRTTIQAAIPPTEPAAAGQGRAWQWLTNLLG